MTLNVLGLFSGIGGLELGLERAGMTTVGQVEIDPYCQRVLAKHWPAVPRHDDVRTAADWWLSEERPTVDVICGGFPCQDISVAGRRAGIIDGERSSLWTYLARTVRVLRPRYVLVENVSAILVRGLDVVAADLAEIGYDLEWDCIPAAAVGAPHRRDRWFGIAYPNASSSGRRAGPRFFGWLGSSELGQWTRPSPLADADSRRRDGWPREQRPRRWRQSTDGSWWSTEPDVGRVAHGIPNRVDRLRALGNAVVPQVAEYVGRLIVAHASERAA
jgi:DNA (cytosine-5)-methyltransferase 1